MKCTYEGFEHIYLVLICKTFHKRKPGQGRVIELLAINPLIS
jgi:hypothetical protein